jgi:hypothetical protein
MKIVGRHVFGSILIDIQEGRQCVSSVSYVEHKILELSKRKRNQIRTGSQLLRGR